VGLVMPDPDPASRERKKMAEFLISGFRVVARDDKREFRVKLNVIQIFVIINL